MVQLILDFLQYVPFFMPFSYGDTKNIYERGDKMSTESSDQYHKNLLYAFIINQ